MLKANIYTCIFAQYRERRSGLRQQHICCLTSKSSLSRTARQLPPLRGALSLVAYLRFSSRIWLGLRQLLIFEGHDAPP